jgi:hypothetical protein
MKEGEMSTSRHTLAWLVAIVTLLAYVIGAVFVLHGFTPLLSMDAQAEDLLALAFAIPSTLACVLALFAMPRQPAPERWAPQRPAIIRLPKSKAAGWALGLTAAFVLAVILFTGNTLFSLMRALRLPEEVFGAVLGRVGGLGLLWVVVCAVGALVMGLVALIRNRDRGLVLGLPLLPAFLVFGFILGNLPGPH